MSVPNNSSSDRPSCISRGQRIRKHSVDVYEFCAAILLESNLLTHLFKHGLLMQGRLSNAAFANQAQRTGIDAHQHDGALKKGGQLVEQKRETKAVHGYRERFAEQDDRRKELCGHVRRAGQITEIVVRSHW